MERPGWAILTTQEQHHSMTTSNWRVGLGPIQLRCPWSIYNRILRNCRLLLLQQNCGIFCFTAFDGGATFETGGQIIGLATTNGGLHGAITAPDGTVYVTPRVATPTVIVSKDNGFSWFERNMGVDVNTPNPRKNSEVSTDSESNAYHIWTGADEGVYMSRSIDSGSLGTREHSYFS